MALLNGILGKYVSSKQRLDAENCRYILPKRRDAYVVLKVLCIESKPNEDILALRHRRWRIPPQLHWDP